jgi:hypothetical protein
VLPHDPEPLFEPRRDLRRSPVADDDHPHG